LRFYPADDEHVLFYGKVSADNANRIFVAVNLDPAAPHDAAVEFPLAEMGIAGAEPFIAVELFSGVEYRWRGARQHLRLDPEVNPAAIFRVER
jgi:starch synthase (maltosyl-transferring)